MTTVDNQTVDPRCVLQLRAAQKYLVGAERNGKRHVVELQRSRKVVQVAIG